MLSDCPSLHSLSLIMYGNLISDIGAQALSSLKTTPGLRKLTLNLGANILGSHGAEVSLSLFLSFVCKIMCNHLRLGIAKESLVAI